MNRLAMNACDAVCRHGLRCAGHAKKQQSAEVRTHVAVDGSDQHRFWHSSAGWACAVMDPETQQRQPPVDFDEQSS